MAANGKETHSTILKFKTEAGRYCDSYVSHSGRRTQITRLANKGVRVRLLAEPAGQSHISTNQEYIDVKSEQLSEAVELL